jgi:integrase
MCSKMKISIKPLKGHQGYKFRATYTQGGSYHQKYFKTKVEAKNFADAKAVELQNVGIAERGVSPAEFRALLAAREISEALRAEHITAEFSLESAVEFYASHLRATKGSVTVKFAAEKFLGSLERKKRSAVHLRNLGYRLAAFESAHGGHILATITKDNVEGYLAGINGTGRTQINHRAVLSNFFNFAISKNWMASNPAAAVEISADKDTPPGILTNDEVTAFLAAADPRIVPAYAIAFFAGLREAELGRLDWADIKLKRGIIDLSARITKTAQRRLVTISPNLRAWLEPYVQAAGLIRPSDQIFRKARTAACVAAGISQWPHNAARHSFASCHLAANENAAKTALELGQRGTAVLFAHYREIITKEDGEAYFQIMPQSDTPANIIRMETAA